MFLVKGTKVVAVPSVLLSLDNTDMRVPLRIPVFLPSDETINIFFWYQF